MSLFSYFDLIFKLQKIHASFLMRKIPTGKDSFPVEDPGPDPGQDREDLGPDPGQDKGQFPGHNPGKVLGKDPGMIRQVQDQKPV
jgi:hypothetical protein